MARRGYWGKLNLLPFHHFPYTDEPFGKMVLQDVNVVVINQPHAQGWHIVKPSLVSCGEGGRVKPSSAVGES